jgi:hypothetical protein
MTLEAARGLGYSDQGAGCIDEYGTDLSTHVRVSGAIFPSGWRVGTFQINYDCATPQTGVSAVTANRTVVVRDTTCPICKVSPGPTTVETSFPYVDAGAVCSDTVDGVLKNVVVTDTVDVEREGTYFVTYRALDGAGNWNDGACRGSTKYIRTITVVDTLKPVVALHYNGKILSHSHTADYGTNGQPNPAVAKYGSFMEEAGRSIFITLVAAIGIGAAIGLSISVDRRRRFGQLAPSPPV